MDGALCSHLRRGSTPWVVALAIARASCTWCSNRIRFPKQPRRAARARASTSFAFVKSGADQRSNVLDCQLGRRT